MNILIFVITMLMLLSLMTYTRLELFRNSQAFQMIFKHYMEESERAYINQGAETAYGSIEVSQKNDTPKEKQTKKAKPVGTSPEIGVKLLLDPTRDGKEKEWTQTKILLKNLIRTLYSKQPFYLKIEEERPSFLDELIRGITAAIDQLPPDQRPKEAKDLANLELSDPVLDKVLYKMLHGALYSDDVSEEKTKDPFKQILIRETKEEATVDDEDLKKEIEFQSPEGYYSLLDFVTAKYTPKVRVYLAPQEVLQAVFLDPATVESVLIEREYLYKRALADEDANELSETFKNQFQRLKDPALDDESLDFSVSKTNPKYYR